MVLLSDTWRLLSLLWAAQFCPISHQPPPPQIPFSFLLYLCSTLCQCLVFEFPKASPSSWSSVFYLQVLHPCIQPTHPLTHRWPSPTVLWDAVPPPPGVAWSLPSWILSSCDHPQETCTLTFSSHGRLGEGSPQGPFPSARTVNGGWGGGAYDAPSLLLEDVSCFVCWETFPSVVHLFIQWFL